MSPDFRRFLAPLFAAWLVPFAGSAGAATLKDYVPLELIFRPYQVERVALAPDGRHLAYDFLQDGERVLGIIKLEDYSHRYFRLGDAAKAKGERAKTPQFMDLAWVSDQRLVFNLAEELLAAINADGSDFRVLSRTRSVEGNINIQELQEQLAESLSGQEGGDPFDSEFGSMLTQESMILDNALSDFRRDQDIFSGRSGTSHRDRFFNREGIYIGYPRVVDWLDDDPQHILVAITRQGGYAVHDLNYNAKMLNQQERLVQRMTRNNMMGMRSAFPEMEIEAIRSENLINPPLIYELDRVNVTNGRSRRVDLPNLNVSQWVTDRQGRLRAGLEHRQTSRAIVYQDVGGRTWRSMDPRLEELGLGGASFSPDEYLDRRVRLLGFDFDPNLLYVAAYGGEDTLGIYRLDLKSKTSEEIARHRIYDLADPFGVLSGDNLLFDRKEKTLVGIRFVDTGAATVWLDGRFGAVQAAIDELMPKHFNVILEWDLAGEVFLIRSESYDDPGQFLVLDRRKGQVSTILTAAPWLDEHQLGVTASFAIPDEQGGMVRGFLTLPPKLEEPKLPFVILPHDGPWRRDRMEFDRNVQALAAQGFAVLRVNFPGSTGYGHEHLHRIRDGYADIPAQALETVHRWFVDTGIGDPRKSGVVGFGYGGYLSLVAASRPNQPYRGAVALVAPVNLPAYVAKIENPFLQQFLRTMMGGSQADLQRISPHRFLDDIPTPVLLVQSGLGVNPLADGFLRLRAFSNLPGIESLRVSSEDYGDWYTDQQVRVFRRVGSFLDEVFNRPIAHVEIGPLKVIE